MFVVVKKFIRVLYMLCMWLMVLFVLEFDCCCKEMFWDEREVILIKSVCIVLKRYKEKKIVNYFLG